MCTCLHGFVDKPLKLHNFTLIVMSFSCVPNNSVGWLVNSLFVTFDIFNIRVQEGKEAGWYKCIRNCRY